MREEYKRATVITYIVSFTRRLCQPRILAFSLVELDDELPDHYLHTNGVYCGDEQEHGRRNMTGNVDKAVEA